MYSQWFVFSDGDEHGPFREQQIKVGLESGKITPQMLIRQDKSDWISAEVVQARFRELCDNGVYVEGEDAIIGPFTREKVIALRENGTINSRASVRIGQDGDWIPVTDLTREGMDARRRNAINVAEGHETSLLINICASAGLFVLALITIHARSGDLFIALAFGTGTAVGCLVLAWRLGPLKSGLISAACFAICFWFMHMHVNRVEQSKRRDEIIAAIQDSVKPDKFDSLVREAYDVGISKREIEVELMQKVKRWRETGQYDSCLDFLDGIASFDERYQAIISDLKTGVEAQKYSKSDGLSWIGMSTDEKRRACLSVVDKVHPNLIRGINAFYDSRAPEWNEVKHTQLSDVAKLIMHTLKADAAYVPRFVHRAEPPGKGFEYYRQKYRNKLDSADNLLELLQIDYEIERAGLTPTQDKALDQAIRDLGLTP